MAKSSSNGTMTKSAEQMNTERREAKRRQQAARKAAAAAAKQRSNIVTGFKFVRTDRREEAERAIRMKPFLEFGRKVNAKINAWLDEADKGQLRIDMAVVAASGDEVQQRALKELLAWLPLTKMYASLEYGSVLCVSRVK